MNTRRSRRPAPAEPARFPIDATLLDRVVPIFEGTDRVDIPDHLFERVKDRRHEGFTPLKPLGIRLRDDVRDWLRAEEIAHGVHTDLNATETWFSIDAYLIIPDEQQRTLFLLRWGKAA